MPLEEINAEGPPDNEPWHIIFLFVTIFGIGMLAGIMLMMLAARMGWWDFI